MLLIIGGLIFFPLLTIGLLATGFAIIALPLIIIIGIIALCVKAVD